MPLTTEQLKAEAIVEKAIAQVEAMKEALEALRLALGTGGDVSSALRTLSRAEAGDKAKLGPVVASAYSPLSYELWMTLQSL